MQLEVGNILEGKVTGITNFGAFVELPEGKTGMVHISEVASTYVNQISDHLQQNQVVKVKVLGISPEGKISLSIKKAVEAPPKQFDRQNDKPNFSQNKRKPAAPPKIENFDWNASKRTNENMSFQDMLNKFKQTSDDKMSDLKKYIDPKRGSANRKTNNK